MIFGMIAALALQVPGPTRLTLDSAVHHAVNARGQVTVAASTVAEARAGRRLASQIPNPAVTFERTEDLPHQHFTFDQPLSWLATRGTDRGAAAAGVLRARADSAILVAGVVQEVRLGFFGALGARESLALVAAQVAAADTLAVLARRRFEAGDIARFESDQAAQDARRARQLLGAAQAEARAAEAAFARAIGWIGAVPPVPEGALDAGLDVPLPAGFSPDSIPMLASVIADSAALAYEYRSVQRNRLPIPSFVGGMEWGDPNRPNQGLSVLGLSVPLPLWNTGAAAGAAARSRADRGAALAAEARLEARRAISQAQVRLEEAAHRARFGRDSLVPAARVLREQALVAYRAGETSILAVLDALRGEREIMQDQVRDLLAFQEALSAWYALFGRMP